MTHQGVPAAASRDRPDPPSAEEESEAVRHKMRLLPVVVTVSLTVAVAYYVYTPLPDAIQEPWKLMLLDVGFRTVMHLVREEMFSLGGINSGTCAVSGRHLKKKQKNQMDAAGAQLQL